MNPRDRNSRQDQQTVSEFQEQVIHIARVARVVKGGRRFRFRALVAVGNGKDKVGVGIAKGSDVQIAVTKAVETAKKKLITVPLVNQTIPHETTSKIGGGIVLLKPAAPGTGVIAGGTVRSILDLCGVNNIISKSLGSTNKVNIAYATIDALQKLKLREEWITEQNKKPSVKKPTASSNISAKKKPTTAKVTVVKGKNS